MYYNSGIADLAINVFCKTLLREAHFFLMTNIEAEKNRLKQISQVIIKGESLKGLVIWPITPDTAMPSIISFSNFSLDA